MLKLFLIPIYIFFSYSIRTPNQKIDNPDLPNDYEYRMGLQNSYYDLYYLTERENGFYYTGAKVLITPYEWLEVEHIRKEAQQIDSESLRLLYSLFWGIKIGGTLNQQNWKDTTGLVTFVVKGKKNKLVYETNFRDRLLILINLGYEIPIGQTNFVFSPYTEFQSNNGVEYYGTKFVMGWKKK